MAQVVQSVEKHTVEKGVVTSCLCLVSDSSSVVAERGSGTESSGVAVTRPSGDQRSSLISGSTFPLRDLQLWQKTSGNASALHGLPTQRKAFSEASLGERDQAQKIRALRQEVQDLTRVLEAISIAQRQLSEREVHPGWSSDRWKSWQDSWFRDEEWTASAAVGNWWADAMSSWNSGEEELGPPLDETMGASWIAQIGEDGVSETEAAVGSFIAVGARRKRAWAQAHELKQAARKDR